MDRRVGRVPPVHAAARTPGVDLATLVRPELVKFPAHDGLELSGWLYRPAARRRPARPSSRSTAGPRGRSGPSSTATYQALLASGIAVFAPNVRGSSGFGKSFVNLDNGALRVNGVKDIEACVDAVGRPAAPTRSGWASWAAPTAAT